MWTGRGRKPHFQHIAPVLAGLLPDCVAKYEPEMNPILDGWEKEKPAKKKRTEKPAPDPTPEPAHKAPVGETNVKTRAQWLDHLKKIQE